MVRAESIDFHNKNKFSHVGCARDSHTLDSLYGG